MEQLRTKLKPLKGFDSFSDVYKSGRKFSNKTLLGSFKAKAKDDNVKPIETLYFGVSIGKKIAKRAVVRNRVKRLMRESIRQLIPKHLKENESCPIEFMVFSWRQKVEKPGMICLQDVLPLMDELISKAFDYFKAINEAKDKNENSHIIAD